MVYLMECELEIPKGKQVSSSMGSVMHGVLMECIGSEAAEYFHKQGMRPYSQSIYWEPVKKQAVWRLGCLTDEAYTIIWGALSRIHEVWVRQKGYKISLKNINLLMRTSYENLAETYLLSDKQPVGARIVFRTTTSFKRNGSYIIFPEEKLIYQSLLNRWNLFSPEPLEEGISEILGYYSQMQKYELCSQSFGVEKQNIHGFQGMVHYCFTGNEIVRRTSGLLIAYADFAGLGIKSALGMGAVATKIYWSNERV